MSVYQIIDDNNIDKKDYAVLFNIQDFYNATNNLSKALTSIWLPPEIKAKFEFLNIPAYTKINPYECNTVTLAFSSGILNANPPYEFLLHIPVIQCHPFRR